MQKIERTAVEFLWFQLGINIELSGDKSGRRCIAMKGFSLELVEFKNRIGVFISSNTILLFSLS